jgi:hypothetical protein
MPQGALSAIDSASGGGTIDSSQTTLWGRDDAEVVAAWLKVAQIPPTQSREAHLDGSQNKTVKRGSQCLARDEPSSRIT